MMSSLANVILFIALVATSFIVAVLYRKLKRFEAYHAEYSLAFERTGEALISAQRAVSSFGREGKETLAALDARIEEAKSLAKRLEALSERSDQKARADQSSFN